jgi:hypothetical protein
LKDGGCKDIEFYGHDHCALLGDPCWHTDQSWHIKARLSLKEDMAARETQDQIQGNCGCHEMSITWSGPCQSSEIPSLLQSMTDEQEFRFDKMKFRVRPAMPGMNSLPLAFGAPPPRKQQAKKKKNAITTRPVEKEL